MQCKQIPQLIYDKIHGKPNFIVETLVDDNTLAGGDDNALKLINIFNNSYMLEDCIKGKKIKIF